LIERILPAPDYVTASASRERLELANEAGSLDLALDMADSIQAQDSLEKMLVHEMAVLHRGMMRAATRMNEEISRLNEQLYHLDEGKREAANVRACRRPRTPEGLERSRRANWKHGHFSREAKAERSRVRAAILALRYLRDSI
jgi:hypothetical protein